MKTIINIKADQEVKEEARRLAGETRALEALIGKAQVDFKRKKNIAGPFETAKEMDKYLASV